MRRGRYGVPMQVYGSILPGAATLARLLPPLAARGRRGGTLSPSRRPHNLRKATWSTDLERRVLALREQYPRWGKDKLVVLLRRQGLVVSTSMAGRILKHLKDTGQLIEPLPDRRKSRKHPPRPY